MRVDFTCARCGKRLRLTPRVYTLAYEGEALCLSCRAEETSGRQEDHQAAATPTE